MPALPVRPRRTIKGPARIMDLIEEFETEHGLRFSEVPRATPCPEEPQPWQPWHKGRTRWSLLHKPIGGVQPFTSPDLGAVVEWDASGVRVLFERWAFQRGFVIQYEDLCPAFAKLLHLRADPPAFEFRDDNIVPA